MYPRSLRASAEICWQCQWRLRTVHSNIRPTQIRNGVSSIKVSRSPRRALHVAPQVRPPFHSTKPTDTDISQRLQQIAVTSASTTPPFDPALTPRPTQIPLRDHLVQWQEQYGAPGEEVLSAFENHPANRDVYNRVSKLNSAFNTDEEADMEEWNDIEDEGEELITIGLFLKPGDVVELVQAGREPVLAVFIQQLDGDSQFYSVDGRWCHSTLGRVAFAITDCIDPSLLEPLVPFLPTSPKRADPKGEIHVPTNIGIPIQRILQGMTREAEKIYRTNAPVLDTAYAALADAQRTRMMTLSQIAKTLLAPNDPAWKPSPAALLAVRKALNHNEFLFPSDIRSHRLTNVFAIRSNKDVDVVETVHEWIRDYCEYLALSARKSRETSRKPTKGVTYIKDFLAKARRLIARSRKDRDANIGIIGPSKSRLSDSGSTSSSRSLWDEEFSSTDKQIINFLQAWVLMGQYVGIGNLHAACTTLVASTGYYDHTTIQSNGFPENDLSDIRRSTGMLFLQEIGVLTPYENRALYDEQLMLPTVRVSRNVELLNTKAEQIRKNPGFRDSMADLRRDWGSMTVYCIDDEGAQEIDDGISIERVNGSTSEFWIHVHVANPTAFFDKTHTLSGLAAHMTESVYTPERAYHMIPQWAAQGHFSLDQDRPVLTFSSRIDTSGNVLETNIQPGTIRKIVTMTPSDLSGLLGATTSSETTRFVVGGEVPIKAATAEKPTRSAEELQDIQDMYKAAQSLWTKRKKAGGVRMFGLSNSVRVFEESGRGGVTWNPPSTDRARFVQGDPIIELTNRVPRSFIAFEIGPSNIVEEMMMLACSTAASWCTDRKIPVMYRGTISRPTSSGELSSEELKIQHILPRLEKHGDVPYGIANRYISSLGRAIAHSSPLAHKLIGVPGYVKVTSPLRRFSDMIAHWQIEAAIRHEARHGEKFNGSELTGKRGILPFTHRQIQESIVTLSPREKIISMTKKDSLRFWSLLALFRAFYYKEAPLPEVYRFWVTRATRQLGAKIFHAQGVLPDYGYLAKFTNEIDAQEGDEWEVQLQRIDVFARQIHVKPIRLLRREEDLL
jgi:hypothetical protein